MMVPKVCDFLEGSGWMVSGIVEVKVSNPSKVEVSDGVDESTSIHIRR